MEERTRYGVSAGQLVTLGLGHEGALQAFLAEFESNPDELHGYFCDRDAPIEKAVALLDAWSRGERLVENWVPMSTWFWELDGNLEGVITLRHQLTPALEQKGGHIGYSVAKSFRRRGVASGMLKAVLHQCQGLALRIIKGLCVPSRKTAGYLIGKSGARVPM